MSAMDQYFQFMNSNGASDLHLQQGQPAKFRISGQLMQMNDSSSLNKSEITSLLKELAGQERWNQFLGCGDLDFAYELNDGSRFRANYLKEQDGFGAVFRSIPSKVLSLEDLNAPETLSKVAGITTGLILVTGPTGSGKSTTLAAIIDHINNTRPIRIVTIEQPVEFMHKNKYASIIHREVGLDTISFATGLRGAMQSSADVVLVGELRDVETIDLALSAAEMGMLVYGTLHTNSAAKTIDRIIDVFPGAKKNQARSLLANSLMAVISQQLVPSMEKDRRYAVHEILLRNSGLSGIIRNGDTSKLISLMQSNRSMGMICMDDSLQKLLVEGKISKEEAKLRAMDKIRFN